MYLEKFLNIYCHEQMFFQIFVAEEDTGQQFFFFIKKPSSFFEVMVLTF